MTKVIQTSEKTFNKKIKAQVIELMPKAKKAIRSHVAGVGYVYFIKDEQNNTLGKVFKEVNNGMKFYIN